ncbi:glycoside hydrolase family 43 protein [Botryobacter ruber]|uniref:glycoside hydrolase family 43 protein n=1 Tax=Botryobacter ruber TaxID=2171629 RepID=UPI000E0C685D|nr:glycoside hydrolase family 43 protein [Botryobacter ruber]
MNIKKTVFLVACCAFGWGCTTVAVQNSATQTTEKTGAGAGYFTNPIGKGADPWVVRKDGYYYACGSGKGGIWVSRSDKLTDLGERKVVWKKPETGWNMASVWAPELHFLDGKWYIYYAAAKAEGKPFIHQRSGVLESVSDDAFGPYRDKGMLYTGDSIGHASAAPVWAIDLTPVQLNGKLYAVWSGWEKNAATDKTKQHLYIAAMRNPWTISSNRVKISSPEESWETGGPLDLNEGPQLLRKNGKAFIIYSCRESWLKEYRLGQLMLQDTTLNPLEPANWVKKGPVFQGTDTVYGVGHASFTTSPDGTEDWIVYHAKVSTQPGWERDIRIQKFTWDKQGEPVFGTPVTAGVAMEAPSENNNGKKLRKK